MRSRIIFQSAEQDQTSAAPSAHYPLKLQPRSPPSKPARRNGRKLSSIPVHKSYRNPLAVCPSPSPDRTRPQRVPPPPPPAPPPAGHLNPDQSLDPLGHEKEAGAVSVQDLLSFVYSPWPALLSRHALHLYHVTLTVSPVCMSWAIRKATNVLCACL